MTPEVYTSYTTEQLVERCGVEVDHFLHNRPSDEQFCLELFRRAFIDRNQDAWDAIYAIHHVQVIRWVHSHPRFRFTGEDASCFVNQAFSRMWQYGMRHACAGRFNTVAEYLQYLKRCTWSAIEDELRRSQKDALWHLIESNETGDHEEANGTQMEFGEVEAAQNDGISVETIVEREVILRDLWELLRQTLEGERERLVAEEMWEYGLAPRQIIAGHPDKFVSENEIGQIRRNIVRRLNRRLTNDAQISPLRRELEGLLHE